MSSLASAVESVELLRPGLAGIEQAREAIQQKISDGGRHWLTIQRAQEIVQRAPPWDVLGQVRELFAYFISPVTGFPYRRGPLNVQWIGAAPARPKGGDCKVYAAQLGAYLEAIGVPVEVVICGQHAPACGRAPRFHHVYVRALVNGEWLPLDPTLHRPTEGFYAEAGDELRHAIERTYPMLGFAVANNEMGDWFGDAIRSVGFALDPSREGSPLRAAIGALNLVLPGAGSGAIAAIDAGAAAKRAITLAAAPPPPPEPAAVSPAPQPEGTKVEKSGSQAAGEKKKGGISAGAVVGGLAAAGVVTGIIVAAVKAGKPSKKRKRRSH